MTDRELHIIEEQAQLFWALLVFVCTCGGTYLLAGTFIFRSWNFFNLDQLGAIVLFLISFWGIYKITEPRYRFTIYAKKGTLIIEIMKGSLDIDTVHIPIDEIVELKFSPHRRRKENEASYDYSTSFHLMYRTVNSNNFKKVIDVESGSITLKVKDIAKLMRYIHERNPDITVPESQQYFL
ncbi:hypothetical protein LX73_0597 [Fodinibius salinus]|uniref:Uncharacterized protein n=1 Tax=Fodinibius salinus TaxID=860790 RepID=A0A5D3YQG6_9BACT|nr:hypothetical protein [Fodinibius salinus]TYP95299.1 hypothetical protein LX73_0597 [Fodinibius salinus]